MDYRAVGLKVGLEIHVQLNTGRKLFCNCPPVIRNDEPHFRVTRRLRPSMSELGEVDPAAMWEFRKHRVFVYEGYYDTTCLVELDEEPPHEPDPESLEVALAVAQMFNAKVFDEIYVMRKIVIDGSNTSGFQRTMLVAHDGLAKFFDYKVPIQTIALEEDAARKIEERGDTVVYRLDRLGIPLIEISTGILTYSPQEIMEVAYYIGHSIKMTGKAKRGLGTVRQDVNVSISNGAKTEIKGVPDLSLIPKVIEYEVQRQLNLLAIRDELRSRGVREDWFTEDFIDVTDIFSGTKSNILRRVIDTGGRVIAIKVPGLRGILGKEVQPGRRFGTELADRVRVWTSLSGLIHSDELPGYGITGEEVSRVSSRLGVDSFILLAGNNDRDLADAVKVIIGRIKEAMYGVPEETRAANPDGTTKFMRPRPGAARMYPETDLRPIRVTIEMLEKARSLIPEPIESRVNRYISYGMSRELAMQVIRSPYYDLIDYLIEEFKDKVSATLIANTLVNTLRSLQRDSVDVSRINEEHLRDLFNALSNGAITKEAIPDVLRAWAEEPSANINAIIGKLGLSKMSYGEVREVVFKRARELGIKDRDKLIKALIRDLRGRADPNDVIRAVDEYLNTEKSSQ
ncbi:glutamyl-tRNA(Gln) amidotransferase subunit E [Vulcanisaeta sp. EB80]|uniref:Glu-tRNA(Gln) amidotransferase subunit GatE n=1 Tax=Vulcanisaeta sp. EB80 TaxID=1650660 RepID=UPI0009BDC1D0|nr:Glu-tRNA(Gln) amidotransferase subunit GatE [Vulcanisaeta sp. EB80]PLC67676.1 glutamyl-tRNA(Gln) amidotransferase subunit E [Vulcanisaeta sp. EB80]